MDFRAFLFAIPQADAAAPSHLLRASYCPCLCVALLHLSLVHPGAPYTASFASIRKQLPVCPAVRRAAPSVFVRCRQANVLRPRCWWPLSLALPVRACVCVLECVCICAKVLCTYPSEPSGSIINVNFYAIIAFSFCCCQARQNLCTERN